MTLVYLAAESQACTDAAAEHLRGMEDQKAALLAEMEEAATAAATSLEAEKNAAAEVLAACQREHADKVAELDGKILNLQVKTSDSEFASLVLTLNYQSLWVITRLCCVG